LEVEVICGLPPGAGGRPIDGQTTLKTLAVRLPMAWGSTTGFAEYVLMGPWTVRTRPVTTVTPAKSVVAIARMMVLRMVGLP
jgi:hypothetical protein